VSTSAAELLITLQQRVDQRGAAVPEAAPDRETHAIAFEAAGVRFIVAMQQVTQVMELPSSARLPGTAAWLAGVANVRGEILPLIDLGLFLGSTPSASTSRCKVINFVKGGISLGAIVDRVIGMRQIEMQRQGDEVAVPDPLSPFANQAMKLDGDNWVVLDLDRLLQSEHFSRVAA
jgi:twitching motility protein PilI